MKSAYAIDGVAIKRPSDFKVERYKVTEAERLANGDMAMDLIARKLKFFFTYEGISASDLNVILDALWENNSVFYTLTYNYNGEQKTASVYVGAIPSTLHRTDEDWVWKDVTFNLIER